MLSRSRLRPVITYDCEVLYRPEDADHAFLPEGPMQCGDGKFSWVAIQHGADATSGSLNIFDLDSKSNTTYPLPGRPGFALATDQPGTFVVGMERSIGRYDLRSGQWHELHRGIDADVQGTIINDGAVCAQGLIFGSKDLAFQEPKAGLYFWRSEDSRLIQLRSDQICSNGKVVLDCNGQLRFLDIDSPSKTVVQYTLDTTSAELGEPSLVLDLQDVDAFPDGMVAAPDNESVIIAFYNPHDVSFGEARQYRLDDGELVGSWRTHLSPRVTCPLLI